MRALIFIKLFFISALIFSQAPSKFYTTFGGNGDDVAYSCKQTLDGNYIIVGSSSSSGFGQTDIYLLKVDIMGQLMWQKFIGGFGNEIGKSVIQLSDSGFVVVGYTSSFGAGGYDIYLIRTDKNGDIIWQKTFGGLDWDFGTDLLLAADGNLVLVGNTSSFGFGKKDGVVIKCDLSGNLIWQKYFGGLENDELRGIFSRDGLILYTSGYTCSFGEINGDMYCVKMDTNGDSLFTIKYGSNDFDVANDVIVDAIDSVILAGGVHYGSSNLEATYVKFNQSKNVIWAKKYGLPTEDEEAYKIIFSAHPIVANYITIFTSKEVVGYKKDAKAIYLDWIGNYSGGQNSGTFGYTGDDETFDITSTNDKGYINCGYTNSYSKGDLDVLIIKRDSTLAYGSSIVGLNERNIENLNLVEVFPNPVHKDSKFECRLINSQINSKIKITVYNISGKEVLSEEHIGPASISTEKMEKGIYLLKIEQRNIIFNQKLVVI